MTEVGIPQDYLPLFEWAKRHYDKQNEFIKACNDHWEVLFVAGNGTGKTHILYWSLIALALGIHPWCMKKKVEPPLRIKVLINDFEHGLEQIFRETAMQEQYLHDGTKIGRMLPPSAVKGNPDKPWSRDDRAIYFHNGSLIFFQTTEQKKRLHSGTNFDILACDEEAEKQVYDESKRGLRTARAGGLILHSFTPPFDEETKNKGPTWTKFDLVDPISKGEYPEGYVIRAAMKDNPAITNEFVRKFSRGKTEEQLRIQLYGEYPTWGKLIFPDFEDFMWDAKERRGNLLPESYDIDWGDPDIQIEMALDWHNSKPPAVIWSAEYMAGPNQGDIVIFDELSPLMGKGLTISGTVQAIREVEGYRNSRIIRWADPKMKDRNNTLISGFSAWEEFRHCGMRFREGWNRDPYAGYSTVNDFLRGKGRKNIEHPRLFIRENCKTVRHNMKNHYNMPKGGMGEAVPDPKFSDYCVNIKYILQRKARKTKKGMRQSGRFSNFPLTSLGGLNPYTGRHV
jgi:hypothetical protein